MYDPAIDLDGSTDWLWEPLWKLRIKLNPVEQELLRSPCMRRLHYIHHCGPIYMNTPFIYSRLQHTLGVFAVIAYLLPEHAELRVSALLHDVGHAPFSHTLEAIAGVDHHQYTIDRIYAPEVVELLNKHGMEPGRILAYITGETASVLRNRENILHIDHLDSWVRSAACSGQLPIPTKGILKDMIVRDGNIYTSVETARQLAKLIVQEAHFHCAPTNIKANVLVKVLVEELLEHKEISLRELPLMTDSMLEHHLLTNIRTKERFTRLMYSSWQLQAARDRRLVPADSYEWEKKKLYTAIPLTKDENQSFYQEVREQFAQLDGLKGLYYTYWDEQ